LLDLQSNLIKDDQALEVFQESRNRIRSMALIHEKLYQSKDLVRIDFAEYIKDLVGGLVAFFGTDPEKISLEMHIDVEIPDIEMAICCGLIVNELVSNSLKHAFPEGRGGEIAIVFQTNKDDRVVLTFSDNGVGFPEHIDFKNTESLGLQLVNTLTDQLDGEIELFGDAGTRFEIVFGITTADETLPITRKAVQSTDSARL
jgi:two-component sensor histidine kinase